MTVTVTFRRAPGECAQVVTLKNAYSADPKDGVLVVQLEDGVKLYPLDQIFCVDLG